jgi:hypothetical protein
MRKTLAKLALIGALALGSVGCKDKMSPYDFNGTIDGEKIEYTSYFAFTAGYRSYKMNLIQEDGDTINYTKTFPLFDWGDSKITNLKLNGERIKEDAFFDVIQDSLIDLDKKYTDKILEAKVEETRKLLNNLK